MNPITNSYIIVINFKNKYTLSLYSMKSIMNLIKYLDKK